MPHCFRHPCFAVTIVLAGCVAGDAAGDPSQPTLLDMQVETMPAVDPRLPVIEQLEVKAVRSEGSDRTVYSIMMSGTLARPDGLDQAYGPMSWAVAEALDAEGRAMRFTTDGYLKPDGLQNEPVAELYKRIGPTMARVSADRLPFAVKLRELDYLTARFQKLSLRSYAIVAEDEREVELAFPAVGESVDVAGAWVLTVEQLSDRQEVMLRAIESEPAVWPLRLELVDGGGMVISKGFRRGTETLDHTLATRWRFGQPTLVPPEDAAAPEIGADGAYAPADAPVALQMDRAAWRLRVFYAAGLHVRQLDAVLGDVQLIDLQAPADRTE